MIKEASMNTDRDPRSEQADRRAEIDRTLGGALDTILRPIDRDRRAQAKRRIVELIDTVVEAQRPAERSA